MLRVCYVRKSGVWKLVIKRLFLWICVRMRSRLRLKVVPTCLSCPRGINVADDLHPEVRAARKLLVPELKQAKEQGKQAWIAFPSRLIIDNVEVKAIRPASVMSYRRD